MGFKDRQTLSDIENGRRALKAEELTRLSDLLGQDLDYFLDPFSVAGEAQFSWRIAPEVSQGVLDSFEGWAGRLIGLLRWLRVQELGPASALRTNLRLSLRSSFEDAQDRAEDLVRRYELGPVPAEKLIGFVEKELDLPVLYIDMPEGAAISGAACHLQDLGVILVNRQEADGRRNYDLAHELFHILTWEAMKPERQESNAFGKPHRNKRQENLADNFAAALLMPKASLDVLVDTGRREDPGHLAEVAGRLHVSGKALAWRLFNLGWINEKTISALMHERSGNAVHELPRRFSTAFVVMLQTAIDRGRLSARKAAKTLGLNVSQLADLFTEHGMPVPFEL